MECADLRPEFSLIIGVVKDSTPKERLKSFKEV